MSKVKPKSKAKRAAKPKRAFKPVSVKPKSVRERIEYKVKAVKGGKYPCACGCKKPVAKLFAKGHVSRFVKLLVRKDLAYCVARLKELKERIR